MSWQPIETLPDDGRLYLIALSGGDVCIAPGQRGKPLNYLERKELAKEGHWPNYRDFTPTHWMEIPKPPLSAKGDE